MSKSATTRRRFLQTTAAGIAGGAAALGASPAVAATAAATASAGTSPSGKPKRIIFLVSDGMSMGVVSMAEALSRQARGKGTHFARLLNDRNAARGFFETYSLNSMVTDSAAAASAWGSGTRVFNGAINTLPDGTELTPLYRLLKDAGIGTGLVTTATVTHATPAGFAATSAKRGDENDIATQYPGVVDIVLGGGLRFYDPKKRDDEKDMVAEYREKGYATALTKDELLKTKGADRILGLFFESHVPYTVDHLNSEELLAKVPTLAEMTSAALAPLTKHEKGFVLQVEGARIDHAAHANDIAGVLWDQIAFDDAIGVCLDYAAEHPDTLVVVTSDHGNANPGLNGMNVGAENFNSLYGDSTTTFQRIAEAKASYSALEAKLREAGDALDAAKTGALVKEMIGIEITADEAAMAADSFLRRDVCEINKQHQKFVGIFGQILGNYTGIGWTGTTHTEDYTVIAAAGPNQDAFSGVLKNTDAFGRLLDAYGISHKNPSMAPEAAEKFRQKAAEAAMADTEKPHWA